MATLMELMDWKSMEDTSEKQIRRGHQKVELGTEMLALARRKILALGGKTSTEEAAELKKASEDSSKNDSKTHPDTV